MATNLERFRKDLEKLIRKGELLEYAMTREVRDDFEEKVQEKLGTKKAKIFLDTIPKDFKSDYEVWYSEALALLRQLLPDRVANFISMYEKPRTRKEITYGNYVIQDYMQGLRTTYFGETKVDTSAAIPQYRQQLAILKAAEARFDSSLFEIRQLVQADLFDTEVSSARALLKGGFLRAAGIVVGVVLEKHLRQVCTDHAITISKRNPTINDFNEMLKAKDVLDVAQWRHISFLADIRNLCGHSKEVEPTAEQVKDLIDGTDKVLKTVV